MFFKRTLLASILVTALPSFGTSSDSCFNLFTYAPPAFSYHLLTLSPYFSMSGYSETRAEDYQYINQWNHIQNYDSRSNYPACGITAQHTYYTWKDKTEWHVRSSLYANRRSQHSTNFYDYTMEYPEAFSIRDNFDSNLEGKFSISAAHYFKWPFFVGAELSPGVLASEYDYRQTNKEYKHDTSNIYTYYDGVDRRTHYNADVMLGISVGAGHIDDISFVIAALNMLDKIADFEKSYTGCSGQHVQDLAALIEKIRKRRVLDTRSAFIENIDTLCTFIQQSGIAADVSPRTVLELADQYNYVFYQSHKKGFSVTLSPSATYQRTFDKRFDSLASYQQNTEENYTLKRNRTNDFKDSAVSVSENIDQTKGNNVSTGITLLARYERPLSRFTQLSLTSSASASTYRSWSSSWASRDTLSLTYSSALPNVTAMESATLAYYPNTRTTVSFSEEISYNRMFDYYHIKRSGNKINEIPLSDNHDRRELQISCKAQAVYYFSPRVQADLNFDVQWNDYYYHSIGNPPWRFYEYYYRASEGFNYSVYAKVTWSLW